MIKLSIHYHCNSLNCSNKYKNKLRLKEVLMPRTKPIYGSNIASQPLKKKLEVQTQPWLEKRSLFYYSLLLIFMWKIAYNDPMAS